VAAGEQIFLFRVQVFARFAAELRATRNQSPCFINELYGCRNDRPLAGKWHGACWLLMGTASDREAGCGGNMAGIVLIRMVCFVLLATCVALCQADRSKASTLPDAPSVQTESLTETVSTASPAQFSFTRLDYSEPPAEKHSEFFSKYFSAHSPSLVTRNHVSMGNSLVSRATFAASSVVFTHDESGRLRPNMTYLLRVLASAAVHSAARPYWRRSLSQPFSDFGATVGNDAGMNVFHAFEPGILQAVKGHEPRFVSRIKEHLAH